MVKSYSGILDYAFLSYSHEDLSFASSLLEGLNNIGARIWYDEGIKPSEEFIDVIAERIKRAKALILIISPSSVSSSYVQKEVSFAFIAGIPIIPIYKESTPLPPKFSFILSDIHAHNSFDAKKNLFEELRLCLPSDVINPCGRLIASYPNNDYYIHFLSSGFEIIKMPLGKEAKTKVLYKKDMPEGYDAKFGICLINKAIPFEFHPYPKPVLQFTVFVDLMDAGFDLAKSYYIHLPFNVISPNEEETELVLGEAKIKTQLLGGETIDDSSSLGFDFDSDPL